MWGLILSMMVYTFNLNTPEAQWQADLCEFKANLVYTGSSSLLKLHSEVQSLKNKIKKHESLKYSLEKRKNTL